MKILELKLPPPLIALFCAIGMWLVSPISPVFSSGQLTNYIVVGLVVVGVALGLLGNLSFRRVKTTVNPMHPETSTFLVTNGVYAFTRNPMYLGLGMLLSACAITLGSIWCFIFIPVFIIYISRFQILPEEQALEELFGEQFLEYKKQVRMWL